LEQSDTRQETDSTTRIRGCYTRTEKDLKTKHAWKACARHSCARPKKNSATYRTYESGHLERTYSNLLAAMNLKALDSTGLRSLWKTSPSLNLLTFDLDQPSELSLLRLCARLGACLGGSLVDIRRTRHGYHVRAYTYNNPNFNPQLLRREIGDDPIRISLDEKRPPGFRQVLFNQKTVHYQR
jgi:hypothetical protein